MMKYSVFIVSTLLVSSIAGLSVVSDPKAAQIPVELLFQENFCKDANITAIKQCLGDIVSFFSISSIIYLITLV